MRRLTLALALVLITACKASDSTAPNTTLANGSMSAKIDGVQWNANASVKASSINSIIAVAGTDASFQTLVFALPARAPGSYNLATVTGANAELTSAAKVWGASANVGGGVITIASLTATEVAGSFTLTLMNAGTSRSITDGKFDIKF